MRYILILFSFLYSYLAFGQATSITITEVANMPEPISNNAVVEGWANDTGYVYSFAGIDTTKIWSGISLKSFRYNTVSDVWDTIPPLPDTMGKIAAGASWVDSIIYVIGGYHVLSNGNEISSNKVHRYDPRTNTYLSDGANIPVPIDDHVQAVWNDSLIYVITGWSNTGNVPNVQIYDPSNDNWLTGTATPNNSLYTAFGASGTIIGNTIYYHGGASTGFNFPGQSHLRIGLINPVDPTQITWAFQTTGFVTYRSASTSAFGYAHWLGGSEITYNYNGIAYNGSGGVPTKSTNLNWINNSFDTVMTMGGTLPMDLRGVGNMSTMLKYIAGGMLNGQQVSDKTYRLDFSTTVAIEKKDTPKSFNVFPNPSTHQLNVAFEKINERSIQLLDVLGNELFFIKQHHLVLRLDVSNYPKGIYFIKVTEENNVSSQKIVIQ